jgi:integrase
VLNPILNVIAELHNKGRAESYLYTLENQLKHLQKYSDLNNPQAVTEFIADKKVTDSSKFAICNAYKLYCEHYKIKWEMPSYMPAEKMPKLPTEEQLNKLITGSGKTLSLKLWLAKETGLRPIELCNLKVKDLDIPHNAVIPTTAKHGCGRILNTPSNLTEALSDYIRKNNLQLNDKIFKGNSKKFGQRYREARKRIATKLNDPTLLTVRLYDFRHWFATMRYWKLRDIPLTANDMGHKDWNTTQKYVHLFRILQLAKDDGFITKTATNVEEARALIEAGFEKHDEIDGIHIYRKRK